jgi:hypothetical protein
MSEHEDVEVHGMNLGNTNETVESDDDVDAHALTLNTNETVESDDDVDAHAMTLNTNETVESDD